MPPDSTPIETALNDDRQEAVLIISYLTSYANEPLDDAVENLLDCGYSKAQISEGIRRYIDVSY